MNFSKNKINPGFTLIELLVIIGIIGILSSVIYASVSGAKAKAANENAKQGLSLALVQAKLYYFANGESFVGVCDTVNTTGKVKSIRDILLSAAKSTKVGDYTSINKGQGSWNRVTCHDGKSYWVAEVPSRGGTTPAPKMYCADSKGNQKDQNITLTIGGTSCQ